MSRNTGFAVAILFLSYTMASKSSGQSGPSLGVNMSLPGAPAPSVTNSGPSLGVNMSLPGAPSNGGNNNSFSSGTYNASLGITPMPGTTASATTAGGSQVANSDRYDGYLGVNMSLPGTAPRALFGSRTIDSSKSYGLDVHMNLPGVASTPSNPNYYTLGIDYTLNAPSTVLSSSAFSKSGNMPVGYVDAKRLDEHIVQVAARQVERYERYVILRDSLAATTENEEKKAIAEVTRMIVKGTTGYDYKSREEAVMQGEANRRMLGLLLREEAKQHARAMEVPDWRAPLSNGHYVIHPRQWGVGGKNQALAPTPEASTLWTRTAHQELRHRVHMLHTQDDGNHLPSGDMKELQVLDRRIKSELDRYIAEQKLRNSNQSQQKP